MPQPASAHVLAFNTIIAELNTLVKSDASEFEKRRTLSALEIQADTLKDLSLALWFSAQGSIAAARRDIKKMHHNHKVSMQHGNDIMLAKNYAVSMRVCGMLREAFDYAAAIFASHPEDPSLADFLARVAYDMREEKRFVAFAEMYAAMTGKQHEHWPAYQDERAEVARLSNMCFAATVAGCSQLDG